MNRLAAVVAVAFPAIAGLCAAAPKPRPDAGKTAAANPSKDTRDRQTAQKLHDGAMKDFGLGNLEAAKAGFQKVLEIAPENAPALINLALIAQRQRRYSEAELLLRRVLKQDLENGAAWLLLGIGAYDQNNLEAATAHLSQAVLNAPKDARARQYLGVTFAKRGCYNAAEEELRRAVELNPKSAEAHFNLAVIYMDRAPAAVELARRHYTRAVELGAPADEKLAERIGK
jgi:Tfp pilus assembly protein PilF